MCCTKLAQLLLLRYPTMGLALFGRIKKINVINEKSMFEVIRTP